MWHDAWLSGPQSRKVISPRGDAAPNLEVGVLIDPIGKYCNVEL